MELKIGDKVKVDGKESVIETFWGAGAHRVFKLKDGRQVLDLTIEAKIVEQDFKPKGRDWNWLPKDEKHDFEE